MLKKIAIILVNYKDYAKAHLSACWASLALQDYAGERKIFIVDNESTDKSLAQIKNIASDAEIIINKNNDGFAKGNNDAIKRALEQDFDYVILFNMDTVVARDCISKMVVAASLPGGQTSSPPVGAVQARLMMLDRPELINSLGNTTHFLGFGYSAGNGDKYKSPPPPFLKQVEICYPSGAAVLFKAELLREIGLFDESMWMYNEDQDLGWRSWLAGFKCVLAPEAVVYHKYEFSRSIKKYYFMDRNRIIAMLKNYHWATLVLIFPAFLVMEVGLMFFSIKNGWSKEKIRVYKYFFSIKHWRGITRSRKQAQSLRKVKDKDIIKLFSGRIWYQEIGEARLKVANVIFNVYLKIIKVLVKW